MCRCSDNNRTALIGEWFIYLPGIFQRHQIGLHYWKIPQDIKWVKNKCVISKSPLWQCNTVGISQGEVNLSDASVQLTKGSGAENKMSKQPFSWRIEGSFREDLGVLGLSAAGMPLRQKVGAQSAIQHFCFDCHLFYIPIKGYMMPPPVHSWYIGFKTLWTALLILVEASSTCLPQKCFTVCTAVTEDPSGIHPPECFLWDFRGKKAAHTIVSSQSIKALISRRGFRWDHIMIWSWGTEQVQQCHLKSQSLRTEAVMPSHLVCRDSDQCIFQLL